MSDAATAARHGAPAQARSAHGAAQALRLQGLAPVLGGQTVVLILGSFPGAASLAARQYYAHPRNQFWQILARLWPQHALPGANAYAARCAWLLARGLGLWDVYASCARSGSLDSNIRHAHLNDFAALAGRCPRLAALAHNGAASFSRAPALLAALRAAPGSGAGPIVAARLPSTSPAHAAWSLERKVHAWGALMSAHGLR